MSYTTLNTHRYSVKTVVIDAGHGGKDQGTHGKLLKEKDVALSVALKLGKIIKENLPDVKVIYTRDSDHFVELNDRALIANKNNADVFISIHCNSSPHNDGVHGTETYTMGLHSSKGNLNVAMRENSSMLMEDDYNNNYDGFDPNSPESYILFNLYLSAYSDNSLNLASKIEGQFKRRVGRHSRGVKQAGFVVLWRTSMPSVLVETGFLSNPKEEKYLGDPLGQTYIASGIYRAFRDYKKEIESI
ncbi:N-acetylmuramoyl-L-alanine amidase [Persicobacter psychrovividus]